MRYRGWDYLAILTLIWLTGCNFTGEPIAQNAEDALHPVRLRCEFLSNPMGIDQTNPLLSWEVDSPRRGARQTAYQVLVACDASKLQQNIGDLWDSGKVESDQTLNLRYMGKPLTSLDHCIWKVRVWDEEGQAQWSEPASWSMGLLNPSDWQGQWIGHDEVPDEEANPLREAKWIWCDEPGTDFSYPPGVCRIRRTFELPGDPVDAQGYFAADDQGNVQVNGQGVRGIRSMTNAPSVDLTALLKRGKNTIVIDVRNAGESANPAGLLGTIVVQLADGTTMRIDTDAQWEAATLTADQPCPFAPAKEIAAWGEGPWGQVQTSDEQRVLPARQLRKDFHLGAPIRRATVCISGLGYYELYLNGRKVGDHVLDPMLTDYRKHVAYVTYDVTEQLRQGDNAVGILLGNGRYFAPRLFIPTTTMTFGYPKTLMKLQVELADGSQQTIVTDASWKLTTDGPIRQNNDYDGEVYDARMQTPGWAQPGFDDSAWQQAEVVEAPQGELVAQMMPPMRVTRTIKPIALSQPAPGVWVFDMGQNMVGWCRLKVNGPGGTAVQLRHAETLLDDGNLSTANLRSAKCRDIYILNGDGEQVYEPRFTYHGFRFVEVTGYPGTPTLDSLEGCVVHTDMTIVGSFKTSDPLVNQIYHNVEWGVRGNYLSIPTDCPQRDERHGWQGDRAAESRGEMYMFDNVTLYHKWMRDIEDSQQADGILSSVCPIYWPKYRGDITWPSAFTIIPQSLYLQYGDCRSIEEHYDAMVRWLKAHEPKIEDGLLSNDVYGDWCMPPEKPELIHSQDPSRKTSRTVLASSYYIYNLRLVAEYARMLGKTQDQQRMLAMADAMTRAFNQKLYDPDKSEYDNGTQTSSVLPLAFGIVPDEQRDAVFASLVDNIEHKTNGHIGVGLIGGQWLQRVLTDGGRPDLTWRMLTRDDYPSWGFMVRHGATTIWELWNGNTADPGMNSGNHVMLVGDMVTWLYEDLAGIAADWNEPGFKHIVMKPCMIAGPSFVEADYHSVRGPISSHWRRDDRNIITWQITIPANTTATVYLPTAEASKACESGKPIAQARGVKLVAHENGRVKLELESGSYNFEIQP